MKTSRYVQPFVSAVRQPQPIGLKVEQENLCLHRKLQDALVEPSNGTLRIEETKIERITRLRGEYHGGNHTVSKILSH